MTAKTRAACYIRVSTASSAQTQSYEYQESYWKETLTARADINLVGIYADLGISGRSMRKRPQFMAMVKDCKDGLIDKIFVKSISRFSRSTVELLDMVRQLREMQIGVYFEQENFDTMLSTSDVALTVVAAVAEADLVRYSENQKWAVAYKYANGYIAIGNRIYGYLMTNENELKVIPHEAEIVRLIYNRYIEGKSADKIAKELTEMKVPTVRQRGSWHDTTIKNMLRNERYTGKSVQHKYVNINGIKHRNDGGVYQKQAVIDNSHEQIIDQKTFDTVQELIQQRTNKKLLGQSVQVHEFSGCIKCSHCGKNFTHKVNNSGTPWQADFYNCATKLNSGKSACDSNGIKDSTLKEKFIECFNEFVLKRYDSKIVDDARATKEKLLLEEREIKAMHAKGYLLKKHYDEAVATIMQKLSYAEKVINNYKMKNISGNDYTQITAFDQIMFNKFVSKITISGWTVAFTFINGCEITKPYTNGKHGNIKDWKVKQALKRGGK